MTRWPARAGACSSSAQTVTGSAAARCRHGLGDHHVLQSRAARQHRRQQGQAVGRGDEHPHAAVTQDEAHLLGLQQGVQRHEHRACGGGAEAGHHGLGALFEVDGHTLTTAQAQLHQAAGESANRLGQGRVAGVHRPVAERHGGRRSACRDLDQFVQQMGFRHGSEGGAAALLQGKNEYCTGAFCLRCRTVAGVLPPRDLVPQCPVGLRGKPTTPPRILFASAFAPAPP